MHLLTRELVQLLGDGSAHGWLRKRRSLGSPTAPTEHQLTQSSPVYRRCLELERMGTVLPPSVVRANNTLRHERAYDRRAMVLCAACEAAHEQQQRRRQRREEQGQEHSCGIP